jgi:hypothetical protein
MEEDVKKKVEEIVGHFKCPKDFKCYQSGLKALCKAKRAEGAAAFLVCLDEDPQECIFSSHISMGDFYLCSCPLRRYIADKMAQK